MAADSVAYNGVVCPEIKWLKRLILSGGFI
jgi:hypothetical protein